MPQMPGRRRRPPRCRGPTRLSGGRQCCSPSSPALAGLPTLLVLVLLGACPVDGDEPSVSQMCCKHPYPAPHLSFF